MPSPDRFNQIARKFSQAETLPSMPIATLKVNRLLDSEEVSLADVEREIVGDPAFTSALLRAASSAIYGDSAQLITTVRAALMRLGVTTVKAVALSLWTQALVSHAPSKSAFSATRFRDHSVFVGYMARYLYSARQKRERFPCKWTSEEVFAMGILHDLGTALFAVMEPKEFETVVNQATLRSTSFSHQVQTTYGHRVSELGIAAVKSWGLDAMFAEVIQFLDAPESHPTDPIAMACVHLADRLANANKFSLFNLTSESISEYVDAQVNLPEAELAAAIESVAESMKEPDQKKRRCA